LRQLKSIPVNRCFVFPDGRDWLVFAPDEGLLFRANEAAAEQFRRLPSRPRGDEPSPRPEDFRPTRLTISPCNACAQACIYCYGTPAHRFGRPIDPGFCEAGVDWVAAQAAAQKQPVVATFHGVGEPTVHWPRFEECVRLTERTCAARRVKLRTSLCTGGQLTEDQARFVAEHFDEIEVSLDGPAEIQRTQRPRRDGGDPFVPALRTARIVRDAGRQLKIKATITAATVHRMVEIVDFVATEIGPGVSLDLGDMVALPWVPPEVCAPPPVEVFVDHFLRALSVGQSCQVRVSHPDISWGSLAQPRRTGQTHLCLTPFNKVVAFYDTPREGGNAPVSGVYGHYDPEKKLIRFDHEKRLALEAEFRGSSCAECLCGNACGGRSGVRGRLSSTPERVSERCRIRIELAQELLRRAAPAVPSV